MAFVSRTSQLRFNSVGNFRFWQVQAAVQDTPAGTSVTITSFQNTGGVPPNAADSWACNVYKTDGTLIRSFALNPALSGEIFSFFFTDTGAAGGAARHDTVYIDQRVTRAGVGSYDYETDGSPSTAPAGFTADIVDRGWIRGTTTLVEAASNVSAGGAKDEPAQYDESLFLRCTLGSASYVNRALAVTSSAGSLSGNTNSTTSATRDVTFANVVDERFPAASTSVAWTVAAPNDANTGQAYTVFSSTTNDTITVDPRLTLRNGAGANGFHFQKGLPLAFESSAHDAGYQMLVSDLGHAAAQVVTARGTGKNGLSYTLTSTSAINGAVTSVSGTTAASDGLDGMTGLVEICPNGKPGGNYNLALDITTPSDIDGASYITNGTGTILVLADDPSLALRLEAGDPTTPNDHWVIGRPMVVGFAMSRRTKVAGNVEVTRLACDTNTGKFLVGSFNYALGRLETLASDGITWEYVEKPHLFSTAPSPGDPWLNLYTFNASVTAQWGANRGGYFVHGGAENGGIYKAGGGRVDSLGTANLHSKWHVLREAIGG